jgi:hypothetical protein
MRWVRVALALHRSSLCIGALAAPEDPDTARVLAGGVRALDRERVAGSRRASSRCRIR